MTTTTAITLFLTGCAVFVVCACMVAATAPRQVDRFAMWWLARRRRIAAELAVRLGPTPDSLGLPRVRAVPVPLGREGYLTEEELAEHGTRTEELRPARRTR